jgi:hypothetical protein
VTTYDDDPMVIATVEGERVPQPIYVEVCQVVQPPASGERLTEAFARVAVELTRRLTEAVWIVPGSVQVRSADWITTDGHLRRSAQVIVKAQVQET